MADKDKLGFTELRLREHCVSVAEALGRDAPDGRLVRLDVTDLRTFLATHPDEALFEAANPVQTTSTLCVPVGRLRALARTQETASVEG